MSQIFWPLGVYAVVTSSVWGTYFFVVYLVVPGIMAAISTLWFGISGFIDLRRLFRDLEARVANPLDNGQVDGHVSLADKEAFEKISSKEQTAMEGELVAD